MPAQLSSKPKRVRTFLAPNGQTYEGGPEEYYSGMANVVGRVKIPDSIPGEAKTKEEVKK